MGLQPQAHAAGPIQVMLLDGESGGPYHAWQVTTPVLKKELEETGLFQVDVVTAPPAGGDFSAFNPDFGKYQVIVMNYDAPDERWPDALETAFESYVSGGGGLVVGSCGRQCLRGLAGVQRNDRHRRMARPNRKIGPALVFQGRQAGLGRQSRAAPETMAIAYRSQSPCRTRTIPSRKGCRTSGCIRATSYTTACADPART